MRVKIGAWEKSRGFSLVEVMVVVGLVPIVALAVAQLLTQMSKGQMQLAQALAVQDMIQEITMLMRGNACTRTLAVPAPGLVIPGTTAGATAVPSIFNSAGTNVITPPKFWGGTVGGQIRLSALSLITTAPIAFSDLMSIDSTALRMTYQRKQASGLWGPDMTKDIALRVVTGVGANNNKVSSCVISEDLMAQAVCEDSFNGTYNIVTHQCSNITLSGNTRISAGGGICDSTGGECSTVGFGSWQMCTGNSQVVVGMHNGKLICGAKW